MKIKNIFTSSIFLKSIFIISLFVLIFISSISYKHNIALTDSSDLLVKSYTAQLELVKLLSYTRDAGSDQRAFNISHDTVFLNTYFNDVDNVNQSLISIKKLIEGNLTQQKYFDTLRSLITIRLANLKSALITKKESLFNKEKLENDLLTNKKSMDLIRKQVNKMIDLETVYLNERKSNYSDEISFTPLVTFLLVLFSLIVFIISYLKINKDLIALTKTNDDLMITNESIKHAEEIGEFSSWQWDLEKNKLSYSDNQYHLLGCEPQSFEPTIENFLAFVHPDDRHVIKEGGNQVMNHNIYPTAFFRIIKRNGEIRYFESLSKLIVDKDEKKILIGINRDITKERNNNQILEKRNQELVQSNKELASFNHVASHDLQEPLRKIQTFISRLSDNEIAGLSEKGKEYFEKIKYSVTRMRVLIDDLLLFSRTNKNEKIFEITDLNILLENAKQDLAQVIEDKNARIISLALPELKVIPFQIQQLFTNLIGNSLKYSKPDVSPVINIDFKLINSNEEPELNNVSSKKYLKISISDNGLGFEQQYADNIFILFHRLHQDSEYEGTGIGLSICKKIVENHSGFIKAEGKLGVGAIFTFFLPF